MKDEKYSGIAGFRLIAVILVIAIHTSPLLSVNETADLLLTRILARTAVPFFFMVTGYFFFSQTKLDLFSYKKLLLKIGRLYGISILLYLPLNLYTGYFSEVMFLQLLQDILVNGTFYHLWYFPALIMGVGIVSILLRYFKFHTAVFTAAVLYLIGLLGDSYYGIAVQIPFLKTLFEGLFLFFNYTRNGLFFAPVFLLLGVLVFQNKGGHSFRISTVGFLTSLLLLYAEGLLLHNFWEPRHDSMYIFLLPCMYFLYQLLVLRKGASQKHIRTMTMFVYIIHPWCIVIVRGFAKFIKAEPLLIQNSIIHFSLVALLSFTASVLLILIWNAKKRPSFQKARAWAEIDLSILKHNVQQVKSILPQGCSIMAVVKADAYGHGDIRISSELQKTGVNAFAVASIKEGVRLRENGIKGNILILGYTHPKEIYKLRIYRLTQTVLDFNYAIVLNQYGKKVKVHIKIDTGMHRSGENADHFDEIKKIFQFPNLIIDGMYTHLCAADSLLKDDRDFTMKQVSNFYIVANRLKALGYCPAKLHIQSSYGLLNNPEMRCSFARMGIALYGSLSNEKDQTKVKLELQPVLSIKARISLIKELATGNTVGYGRQFTAPSPMKIAMVTIGYADGIPRNLTYGNVLIKGNNAPIIGRISMDQLSVNISELPEVEPGDIVTIIGQDGKERISAEQFARQSGTITNEILSRLGSRLERVYLTSTQ